MHFSAMPSGHPSAAWQTVITVMALVWLIGIVAWSTRTRTELRFTRILLLIGANCAGAFQETANDFLCGVLWAPSQDDPIVYTAFGQGLPPWIFLLAVAAPTTCTCLVFIALDRPRPLRSLWATFAGLVAAVAVLQVTLIHTDILTYQGSQSFRLISVPWVWLIVHPAAYMLVGLAFHGFNRRISGLGMLMFIPLSGSIVLGGVAFFAWPTIVGIGASSPPLTTNLLGIATAAISLMSMSASFTWVARSCPDDEGDATSQVAGGISELRHAKDAGGA